MFRTALLKFHQPSQKKILLAAQNANQQPGSLAAIRARFAKEKKAKSNEKLEHPDPLISQAYRELKEEGYFEKHPDAAKAFFDTYILPEEKAKEGEVVDLKLQRRLEEKKLTREQKKIEKQLKKAQKAEGEEEF